MIEIQLTRDSMFIFDRGLRTWATETPDKYERDWKYQHILLPNENFPVINERSFSNPHPWNVLLREVKMD